MKFLNKKSLTALALTLVMGLTGCGKAPEGVVATVNDENISEEKFVMQYAAQRNQYVLMAGTNDILEEMSHDGNKTIDETIKEYTLKNLEQMEILKQDAAKSNITVDQSVVDKQIEEVQTKLGGEEAFREQLSKIGSSPEFYKSYLEDINLMDNYYKGKVKELEPSEEDIKKYYEEHKNEFFTAKASHILVEDEKTAKEIKKELDKGANFEKLAKEKSIEPAAKESGGNLGEFPNDAMDKDFSTAIANMKAGEISDPVKTQYGYHIIKLDEKKERTFDEIKDSLKEELIKNNFTEYIEKLQNDAKIKEYLDYKKEIEIPEEYKLKELPELDKQKAEEAKKEEGKEETKDSKEEAKDDKKEESKDKKEDKKTEK
ncbi:peptidylprolyl isomerase [Peptoniphilus stercorisuis]|uniref:peptidylprolyl isomerase n=1 Tax=Peptoniphilus stercorisuis TaxID=1436965 RepID=A0ABS4KDW1_9FIRM|nr:peptidylprolyl isomerase [Peptoniphilus stercorisuis]MBP2025959.1 parvulin-like peptidyl-prolyl isomerase [Peptoniphilus stercorisuis]